MNIQEIITDITDSINSSLRMIAKRQKRLDWIKANQTELERIGCYVSCGWTTVDFDNPTREQVLDIIKTFHGDWDKAVNENAPGMVYTTNFNGIDLRIWNAPILPTCKLTEYEVEVPATKIKKYKLECNPPLKEQV